MTLDPKQIDNFKIRVDQARAFAANGKWFGAIEGLTWVLTDILTSLAYQTEVEAAKKNRPTQELKKPEQSEFQRRIGDARLLNREVWNEAIAACQTELVKNGWQHAERYLEVLKEPS